ncbi:tetraspanin-18-like [Rutidosis leptorrhynchoides]|uniref:tetraspanin-18-like n=1 Tax=Rutidosis leptorrhynchoides TaxID=125765 RepID=UPI003A98F42A
MRRPNCCHTCLAFILKFLNLFQLFVGISIISYSVYILNQWNKHLPDSSDSPWFIFAFMGLGIVLCCISCTGHIAAEAINGCCLCFYGLLKTVFILLEVAFVLFIALDRQWEMDLPSDPTGEIDKFRVFIESNFDFCKWIGITVVVIQVVCLMLAVVLRATVSSQIKDDQTDIEKDGAVRGKAWEPLLNPRANQTSVSVSGDGKAFRSDIWSSRMREKYGLSSSNVK